MKKITLLFIFLISNTLLFSQEDIQYQKPSEEILKLVDYERPPSVKMDSKKEYMLFSYTNTYKTLNDLNEDELKLGGLRINPNTNISSTITYINNLKIRKVNDFKSEPLQVTGLPTDANIAQITWSPDDTKIAFTHTTKTGVELWMIDVKTAQAKKLTDAKLNCNMQDSYHWHNDNQRLLVKMIPNNIPKLIDEKNELPTGPIVSVASGKESQNRTYQDLLKNKIDEQNFETIATSELYFVSVNGEKKLFKEQDMYTSVSLSPDGNFVMLTTIQKPFSYIVPYYRFPQKTTVYDLNGKEIKVVNEVPLIEIMPKGFSSTRTGKRNMDWRTDQPATLYYVEALDEGNQKTKCLLEMNYFRGKHLLPKILFLSQKPFSVSHILYGEMTTSPLFMTVGTTPET
jgi:WD40 repeat protein